MIAERRERRLAWTLTLPALSVIAVVAVFPIVWTFWESLHQHDLRMPWLGRPFIGGGNYVALAGDSRVWEALGRTGVFVAVTLALELAAGLLLAVALDRVSRARGLMRTAVLLPWAVPTVVVALVWRFIFESPDGLATALVTAAGFQAPTWFADAIGAWVPLILADAWKTTPFVAILLLAGLQTIDGALYEAARMDGAGAWRQFTHITLPLLKPALLVAALFRALDAFRVFDLVYVMTGGGPGTATEPIALLTFTTLLQNLEFGRGAALSIVVFVLAFLFALAVVGLLGRRAFLERVS
ncbi:MAG TPA: sugar ABC transporter permease [Vicinamibacterales bacterium]|nr:sugar ABC transporter permease [Vicinamibacterales bacterium]